MDKNLMEVKETDISKHIADTFQLLTEFSYAPRHSDASKAEPVSDTTYIKRQRRSTIPGMSPAANSGISKGVHLIETINSINKDDPLATEVESHIIRVLRRGGSIASEMVEIFGKTTKLNQLKENNKVGKLSEVDRVEFTELLNSASLIGLFVIASYVNYMMSDYMTDTDTIVVSIDDPKEIVLDNPLVALKGMFWELDDNLKKFGQDEVSLIRIVKIYFAQLLEELQIRKSGLKHLDNFMSYNYRVEKNDFNINGFETARKGKSSKLIMTFKTPHEVVGNHIAKYQALKLSKMLMCYDFKRKYNPFAELGGFIFTFMGDGNPGTGKTTIIQMMCGLLNDYCQNVGYPFYYENFSSDNIDSYQGKSGQNCKAFINNVLNPSVIGFGTIDDIDQVAGKRGDKQSSAGQQEVTGVLMESFAGANTVVNGNCTFGMFSNYPEMVDDALRQRAGARWLIDGPQTLEDYIDILALLMGDNHNISTGDIDLFVTQNIKAMIGKSYEKHNLPQEEKLREVFDATIKAHGKLDNILKLGTYLKAIQEADSRFTGRAIKNITDAVKMRAMEFEVPDEWMEDRTLFLDMDYDKKLAMLADLTTPITTDMMIQEINRYADSEFRYADKSDEADIKAMVRNHGLQEEAKRRIAKKES